MSTTHPLPDNRDGYTLIELIGAVVIISVLLTLAIPAVAHAIRVRTAEAVLKHDLVSAANVYEQAYLVEHRYPPFADLQARIRLSPDIALDSQSVGRERIYLRLRHVPTGQLCALDYSRSSSVARNRPDCYAGGQVRDTALAVTAEPPTGLPGDTFGIVPPGPIDSAQNPLALLAPLVEGPPDRSAAPGAALEEGFTVTNRSPVARRFRFDVGSSDPGLVAAPDQPPAATLQPNVPTVVPVRFSLAASALAGTSSVIALRATDDADDRWSGAGNFTVSTELVLAAPSVAVTGPAFRVEPVDQPFDVSWTVTNNSNAARVLVLSASFSDPPHAQLVSTAGFGRLPFGPGESRTVTARIRLSAASDGGTTSMVTAEAVDAGSVTSRAAAGVKLESATVLAAPSITTPSDAGQDPGSTFTLAWTVRNLSNRARSIEIAAGVDDASHLTVVGQSGAGVQVLSRGQSISVAVTYRMADQAVAARRSPATLVATDRDARTYAATAAVDVVTNTSLALPTVSPPGAVTLQPGSEGAVTWQVRNGSNAPRVLVVDAAAASGDVDLVSSAGSGEVTFGPYETRSVSTTYRVRRNSVAGTRSPVSLVVRDKLVPGLQGSGAFEITTALDVEPPLVSAPGDRGLDPGTAVGAVYRLTNQSNASRTFVLDAATSDPAAVQEPGDPAAVTLPPFGAVDVTVVAAVPSAAIAYSRASVRLSATDAAAASAAGAASSEVTVNPVYRAPSLSWRSTRTVVPGSEVSDTADLVNGSNLSQTFCFSVGVGAGSVSGGLVVAGRPAAPACMTLGPAGTPSAAAPVSVGYAASADALAGWTNELALSAVQQSPTPMAVTASVPVTTALVLRDPSWEALPTSPMYWDAGEVRALGYTFRNGSNAERTFCVSISSADTSKIAANGLSLVCGIRVAARDTFRLSNSLRASAGATGVRVAALVYDESDVGYRAEGEFYNVVRETRPTAVWDAPGPVYLRKWATFDGSRSWSPVGSPIVRYEWSWGMFMQRWDATLGRFVYTGTWELAKDAVGSPAVDRAFDLLGTFQVCLTVVDAAGRSSDPNCQSITTIRPTVARLAWRYRGWWSERDFCLDVWWDNQCDSEHGNARWEIDLRPSVGDVPIKEANATFTVRLYNTDDPDRSTTVTFSGNAGTTPVWGAYSFGSNFPEAVSKAQDGMWRVNTTVGTAAYGWPAAPNLANHPLVQNINLAHATGVFDGGPHWVPDGVWITLRVKDANDHWTTTSAYRDHIRTDWKRGYDTTVVADPPPVASVSVEKLPDGAYRATGSGESPDGRIVDAWWEIETEDIVYGTNGSSRTARGSTVDVTPEDCERVYLTYAVKDDHGEVGRSTAIVQGSGGKACFGSGPGPFQPAL
jgi:prepilin-type N-terminal cleavage/methylation domain-containing protein